ncbi:Uncharacterised protein [Mycobacteroides abscessus subsp. abscessus]|nr:Uncharacterised protein [Mycobacteroides abscessus subsp. abscessus]
MVAGVGIGSAIGSASKSPRIRVIRSSPGAVAVMGTDCSVGVRMRSPSLAVNPCRTHTEPQLRV